MKVYYISSTCSKKSYKELIEDKGLRNQQQSQKYNYLLAEGLLYANARVEMISVLPINRGTDSKIRYNRVCETEGGLHFCYVPFLNFYVLRNISVLFSVIRELLRLENNKKRDTDTVFLCDALNVSASLGTIIASKIKKIKRIAIVTDVPRHRPNNKKPRIQERINLWLMKKYDAFLLLTKAMNRIVNPNNRPYIVLEGHADFNMVGVDNSIDNKYEKKVCLYAGSTRQIYGIENLIRGFLNADIEDSELHIYGNGDYDNEIKRFQDRNPNKIKFFGIAPNEVVLSEEQKAWLLINPRPTNEEYTHYSFPSKNMEYMASGTAVLTTRLPGMPAEYEKYVLIISREDSIGVGEAIKQALDLGKKELAIKGSLAKKFVLSEKNNRSQAQKLADFIMDNVL